MKHVPLLLLPALLGAGATATAQVPPDAGALRQQIERNLQPELPKKSTQDVQAPPPPLQKLGTATVTVAQFRIVGATLVDEATLQRAVEPYRNRPLSFQELQRAALAVQEAYRQAGWIARAYLPRQEIDGASVTIQVIEARFGGVRNGGAAATHVGMDRIQAFVDAAQPTGAPLNADALDRALLLIDDLPGVSATGNLAAGAHDNETVVVIKLEDEPWVAGNVGLDNTGAHSTGAWEATANLVVNSPFRIGDSASVDLIHADGSDYARLAFGMPLGSNGWRAGISASSLDYRLVTADFAALQAHGDSTTFGADSSYPLIRSRFKNLFVTVNVDDKQYDNKANGTTTSKYRVDSLTAGLNGNLFDDLGGGGSSAANLSIEQGHLDLGGSPSAATDAATVRAAGSFTKLRYGISRQQQLTETWSVYGALSGQQASKNLDSSEKFYLGGNAGVRAYPTSEAGGSQGQLVNLELRAHLPAGFSATGFVDYGHVTVNNDNDFHGAAAINSYSLKGAGVSVGWFSNHGPDVKATFARRIGSNPNPNANGTDEDGTLKKSRFWLTATLPF